MIYQTKSERLTAPEEGKHSLWNMCLQWNTTTLNGLAMSETLMSQKKKEVKISFQTQHNFDRFEYVHRESTTWR